MPRSAHLLRAALLLGTLSSSACTINLVKNPKEPQLLHEQVQYFKWLYDQGFYRTEPELMRRAALRMFGIKPTGEERSEDTQERLEQLLLRLEQELEKRPKSEPKQP